MSAEHSPETDYHKDPTAIFCYGTKLRLVVNLQTNVKAMQSEAYARKVKITNLQQMANTLIYIQEHGYDTRENLTGATSEAHKKLDVAQKRLSDLNAEMKTLNAQIHYTGQYFASKAAYANSHFLRPAGPYFPDSPGHIKRTAWDISRAEGTPPY